MCIFSDCISEINYTQVDDRKSREVLMSMYGLLKCRDNY